MSNTSLVALGEQSIQPSHKETETTVVHEPVEQQSKDTVCAATLRYLTDAEVNALREEVLHYDFLSPWHS